MNETLLDLWEFEDAPDHFKRLLPTAYAGGWLAFIYPTCGAEVAQVLIERWNSLGFALARFQLEDGGILLAGHHPPGPLNKPSVH